MILEGSVKVKAPIDKLYDFVMKPESIMGCLPGAEPPTVIDDKTYTGVMKQKVGVFGVKMKYTMHLISTERPTSMVYEGEGEDMTKLGRFKMKMDVKLNQVGEEVEIVYTVDVSIVGKLAMFGDRIMKQKTAQIEKETTKNLQEKLRSNGVNQQLQSTIREGSRLRRPLSITGAQRPLSSKAAQSLPLSLSDLSAGSELPAM